MDKAINRMRNLNFSRNYARCTENNSKRKTVELKIQTNAVITMEISNYNNIMLRMKIRRRRMR